VPTGDIERTAKTETAKMSSLERRNVFHAARSESFLSAVARPIRGRRRIHVRDSVELLTVAMCLTLDLGSDRCEDLK